jgi:hypothetical protein
MPPVQTADELQGLLAGAITRIAADGQGRPSHAESYQMKVALLVGGRLLVGSLSEKEAIADRDRVRRLGLSPLGRDGDEYAADGAVEILHLPATPAYDETWHITRHPAARRWPNACSSCI